MIKDKLKKYFTPSEIEQIKEIFGYDPYIDMKKDISSLTAEQVTLIEKLHAKCKIGAVLRRATGYSSTLLHKIIKGVSLQVLRKEELDAEKFLLNPKLAESSQVDDLCAPKPVCDVLDEESDYLGQLYAVFNSWLQSPEGRDHKHKELLSKTPDIFKTLCRLVHDDKVSESSKAKIAIAITYFILPFDLIPEALIGPSGYLDDLVLSGLALRYVIEKDGKEVVRRYWNSDHGDVILITDEIVSMGAELVGNDIYQQLARKVE